MNDLHASATGREIHSPPALWRSWRAGRSADIGQIIAASALGRAAPRMRAKATAVIVAPPRALFQNAPKLEISLGPSGNSARSIGALDALDALALSSPPLNIICNTASHMAQRAEPDCFALACVLVVQPPRRQAGARARRAPAWALFLRRDALQVAALELMELKGGQLPTSCDSAHSFRHGPKRFVNWGMDICQFGSNIAQTAACESDPTDEVTAMFARNTPHRPRPPRDWPYSLAAPLGVAQAQILAATCSQDLGLTIYDPSSGKATLSRVAADVLLQKVLRR